MKITKAGYLSVWINTWFCYPSQQLFSDVGTEEKKTAGREIEKWT